MRRHKGLVSVPTTGGRDGAQFAVSFVHLPGSTCCREHRLLSSFSSCRYFLKEKSVSTKTSRLHPPEFTDVPWAPPGPRSPRSLDSTPKPQGSERHLIVWISPNHNHRCPALFPITPVPHTLFSGPRGPILWKNMHTSLHGPTPEADPNPPSRPCRLRQLTKPFSPSPLAEKPTRPQRGRLPPAPQGCPGGAGTSLTTEASKSLSSSWTSHCGFLFLCLSLSRNHAPPSHPRGWRHPTWAHGQNWQEAFPDERVPTLYSLSLTPQDRRKGGCTLLPLTRGSRLREAGGPEPSRSGKPET